MACEEVGVSTSANSHPLLIRVVIRLKVHHRRIEEVMSWRRGRGRFPFEAGRTPRILACNRTVFERPQQIDSGDNESDREDAGARRRQYVQHLKLLRIRMVTP